jgi:hypothetical protein
MDVNTIDDILQKSRRENLQVYSKPVRNLDLNMMFRGGNYSIVSYEISDGEALKSWFFPMILYILFTINLTARCLGENFIYST